MVTSFRMGRGEERENTESNSHKKYDISIRKIKVKAQNDEANI